MLRWVCSIVLVGLLATSCATRPPRTIEQAQRLYQRRLQKARGNPTLVPYFPR